MTTSIAAALDLVAVHLALHERANVRRTCSAFRAFATAGKGPKTLRLTLRQSYAAFQCAIDSSYDENNIIVRQLLNDVACVCFDDTVLDNMIGEFAKAKTILRARNVQIDVRKLSYTDTWNELPSEVANVDYFYMKFADCLTDVEALARAQHVTLECCWALSDVRPLANVHKVVLADCLRLVDVSPLGGVHDLTLSNCGGVRDVSALGTVHTLSLSMMPNLTDVSALGTVHTLSIALCASLVDVSALGTVKILRLKHCNAIVDVSALVSVHDLTLVQCRGIVTEATALNGMHRLTLVHCNRMPNDRYISGVKHLHVSSIWR